MKISDWVWKIAVDFVFNFTLTLKLLLCLSHFLLEEPPLKLLLWACPSVLHQFPSSPPPPQVFVLSLNSFVFPPDTLAGEEGRGGRREGGKGGGGKRTIWSRTEGNDRTACYCDTLIFVLLADYLWPQEAGRMEAVVEKRSHHIWALTHIFNPV